MGSPVNNTMKKYDPPIQILDGMVIVDYSPYPPLSDSERSRLMDISARVNDMLRKRNSPRGSSDKASQPKPSKP
jgi:hypothetical protein